MGVFRLLDCFASIWVGIKLGGGTAVALVFAAMAFSALKACVKP